MDLLRFQVEAGELAGLRVGGLSVAGHHASPRPQPDSLLPVMTCRVMSRGTTHVFLRYEILIDKNKLINSIVLFFWIVCVSYMYLILIIICTVEIYVTALLLFLYESFIYLID